MRSKWSADFLLLFLATAVLEAAWLTLINIQLQWLKNAAFIAIGILPMSIAVIVGMFLARSLRHVDQRRFSLTLTGTAIGAGVIGAALSGAPTTSVGDFLNSAVLDPGAWLLGIAVFRGSAQADPASGYETERVFSLGVPGLVVFWLIATITLMTKDATFTAAAFATSLTFVSAGLLSLGLGRLRDLEVDAVDTGARRRWLGIVLAIVGLVLVIGIPLAGVLGLPVTSALVGVLGPLTPLLIGFFSLLAIPLFALFSFLFGILKPNTAPVATLPPVDAAASGVAPPVLQPPSGAPPDLTLLLIIILVVGALVLLRIVFVLAGRANLGEQRPDALETRSSEPIELPSLPHLPHLPRFGRRRRQVAPRTAVEAYVLSLAALAGGPFGRLATETPREHALRVSDAAIGRDVRRLATDYQLDQFARRRLTTAEVRRAIDRWRRIVAR